MSNIDNLILTDMVNNLYKLLLNSTSYLLHKDYIAPSKKGKIYLAGPWFDFRAKCLIEHVQGVYEKVKDKSFYDVYFPIEHQNASPNDTFNSNVQNIKDCDIVVALISRKDVGTAFEIGLAHSLNKRIILVGYDEKCYKNKTNIMLAFSTKECITIDNFIKVLVDDLTNDDYVIISDDWEDKE